MNMKRKNYWLLFAILLLSLTSLSPSFEFTNTRSGDPPGNEPVPPTQTPDAPESDLGPIQVGVQMDDAELKVLQQMNIRFMERTGAEVEIIPLDTIISDAESLMLEMSLGEAPDILFLDSQCIESLAIKGFLLPIDVSQAAVPDSRIPGSLLSLVQWNGYQWGVPFDMDPYVFVWKNDKDAELPSSRKAWLEFKQDQGKESMFVMNSKDPYAFAAAVSAFGGDPSKPDQDILHILSPSKGASWFKQQDAEADLTEQIEEENAAIAIGAYSSFPQDLPGEYRMWLPDYDTSKHKPVIHSRSFAITSHSESSQLAMSWISEMSSKEMKRLWFESTGKLPALSDFYNPGDSAGEHQLTVLEELQSIMEHAEVAELSFGRGKGLFVYSNSVVDLMSGQMNVEDFREQYETPAR
ncbi:extracellular solute-binding protein [Paenibacillus faecalis]|uniref:extracellular solute-binding protein n=1 Tax=Paenibacillus faecalis TaxID=2079532 RepID=UPI000D0EDA67|nr:extracellular solute-binding protein [Paenibacillus faecalis]